MYAEFLKSLSDIAEKLNEAAKIGGGNDSLPLPYLAGRVEVRLDGSKVGYFEFEDDFVLYHEDND